MRDPEEIHLITKALAECWNENDDQSFGEMIDNIFVLAKGQKQIEFWNMDTDKCLTAISEYREKRRKEREKDYLM
jgi:hypothetical protein